MGTMAWPPVGTAAPTFSTVSPGFPAKVRATTARGLSSPTSAGTTWSSVRDFSRLARLSSRRSTAAAAARAASGRARRHSPRAAEGVVGAGAARGRLPLDPPDVAARPTGAARAARTTRHQAHPNHLVLLEVEHLLGALRALVARRQIALVEADEGRERRHHDHQHQQGEIGRAHV